MTYVDADSAIRRIIAGQVAAWNAGDGVGYSRAFASDGNFTNIYGQSLAGRDEFQRRHVQILATFFRGSVLEATVRSLRLLGAVAAVAEIETAVRGAGAMPPGIPLDREGGLRTQLLEVFELQDGEWRIVAYHNVAVVA